MKTVILHEGRIGTQFPCALEYGDYTGLLDTECRKLDDWHLSLSTEAEDRCGKKVPVHFEYGEESEFAVCAITGLRGDCVAVTAFILI